MTDKENQFANLLNKQKRKWELCDRFPLSFSSYQPDFYLPDEDLYIEVVGSASGFSHNKHKYEEFIELYPDKKFVLVHPNGDIYTTLVRRFTGKKIRKLNTITCSHCLYTWNAKKLKPIKCPRCSSYDYDKPKV